MSDPHSDLLNNLKLAVIKIKTAQLEIDALKGQLQSPIAVIGLSCRFPGGANDSKTFWKLLCEGYDGISEVPKDRWDIDKYYDPDPDIPGKMYTRKGGFLNIPVDQFDAQFFGISPREAEYMDPQQRLFLEVAWEALENSGIDPLSLKGSPTGVFAGVASQDYSNLLIKNNTLNENNGYLGTGIANSVVAGRLSYFLGLQGPSFSIDTACSSSLSAVHVACMSLQRNESTLAIAGGVNLMLAPDITINFCKSRLLAKDGYCKTFDVNADGYVRGEGCGIVILKRFADAVRDNDNILAVIKASGVNQDGASTGLTAPSGEAQRLLLQHTLQTSKVDANLVDYIEVHGVGTPLGDPIEVSSLKNVYKGVRKEPLWIGSVKTNIGHLEASSGIAGLIKTILALRNEAIPPHLHFEHLNPNITLDDIPAAIPLKLIPWKHSNEPRFAAVNSFGFSGANAHVILEEGIPAKDKTASAQSCPLYLITLSAKNFPALHELVFRYSNCQLDGDVADVAYTAHSGRSHFNHRLIIAAKSKEEFQKKLKDGDYKSAKIPQIVPKLGFVFKGITVVEDGLIKNMPDIKQDLENNKNFAEIALMKLWKNWGVTPNFVIGEGSGEIVAAVASGIITDEDGLKLLTSKNSNESITYHESKIKLVSSWTGLPIGKEGMQSEYWKEHNPVPCKMQDAIIVTIPSNWDEIIELLGRLYLEGYSINWENFDKPFGQKKIDLPNYPFQRQSYWFKNVDSLTQAPEEETHPLLGILIDSPGQEKQFKQTINVKDHPYLKDHLIFDKMLFPGAGFFEMFRAAAAKLFTRQQFSINEVTIDQPLSLSENDGTETVIVVKPLETGFSAAIYSLIEDKWIHHAKANLSLQSNPNQPKLDENQFKNFTLVDVARLYRLFDSVGLHYGPDFQTIKKIWKGDEELIAELQSDATPALLDGVVQSLAALISNPKNAYLPYSVEKIECYADLTTSIRLRVQLKHCSEQDLKADFQIYSINGDPLMSLYGFHARRIDHEKLKQMLSREVSYNSLLYRICWIEKPLEKVDESLDGPWLTVSDKMVAIEGLINPLVKPQDALEVVKSNQPKGILWFAEYKSLNHLLTFVHFLQSLQVKPKLILITYGIENIGPITHLDNTIYDGFYKTLRLEIPDLDCRHIDLIDGDSFPLKEIYASDGEGQTAYRQNIRYVPRLKHIQDAKRSGRQLIIPLSQHFQLEMSTRGSFENFYLKNLENPALGPRDISVEIEAAGLNFRDVLDAMGFQLGQPGPLGAECAGKVKEIGKEVKEFKVGDSVLGFAQGCFASTVSGSAELFVHKPSHLTYTEAAGLPIAFSTAYEALINLAKLQAGDKVLIHAAAGGVGLAAVQIAQMIGAEIYATAGSQEKQNYLRSLGIKNIYSSRNLNFSEEILKDTSNEGINVVINSLSGDGFIEHTLNTCAVGARFVEIGKRNIWTTDEVEEKRPDITYFILALDDLLINNHPKVTNLLKNLISLLKKGLLKALPTTCFSIEDSQPAFEYLQKAKNIGKVVITLPKSVALKIDPTGSYLITGGFGGLGFKIAEWLGKQGAKHLVLAGRHVRENTVIEGVDVIRVAVDISQPKEVETLVSNFGGEWPELKGIIHCAGVLEDGAISVQDGPHFEKVFAPKVKGSLNLHSATLGKPLEFFVLFSSIAGAFGSPGQLNYASANAFLDSLAFYRRNLGLPGLSIGWGPWAQIGLASSIEERNRSRGIASFKPEAALQILEAALNQPHPHLAAVDVNWSICPYRLSLFNELNEGTVNTSSPILLQRLEAAIPSERKEILVSYLQKTAGKVLCLNSLEPDIGFFEAGMNSLMTEEFQEKLQADLGTVYRFPTTLAFDYPNIQKLAEYFEQNVFPLIGVQINAKQKTDIPLKVQEVDKIAVIGMSCRFPGGANSPQAFWSLLEKGFDGISKIPRERWDIETFYDPKAEGKMYLRNAGFLNVPVDAFDASFFGISPRETERMDPQQRLLMEVSWEALENSGINPMSLEGTSTGVFIGVSSHDYIDMVSQAEAFENLSIYHMIGNAGSVISGRLSYFLGLRGPSLVVDTACSSSLYALHAACQSLLSGESNLALAGGVQLILNPGVIISFCEGGMLAKDGRCKTFDAEADGFGRGEGCGMLVLKRLSEAIKDGDSILGVIRSTEVNQDGATAGLTVPNGESQKALLQNALKKAFLHPEDIDYIEAHGTGTPIGDPIEIGAITSVYGGRHAHPLMIGSVKTNIGHLEAAAGIAGLIKILLSFQNEKIPPHLHFHHLNPRISLEAIPAKVPVELISWKRSNRPRIAGISGFGFSGSNAHIIIEEPPIVNHPEQSSDRPLHVLTVSARSDKALEQLIDLYSNDLHDGSLANIAYSANTGRSHFIHRACFIASTKDELLEKLKKRDCLIGEVQDKQVKTVFFFPDTKTSWDNELITTSLQFKDLLEKNGGLFEYAIYLLWKSWGIKTDYVRGEGRGDIVAAIAAEIITLADGLKLLSAVDDPAKFKSIAKEIAYNLPQTGFISSQTNEVIRKEGITADYWININTVRPSSMSPNRSDVNTFIIPVQDKWNEIVNTLAQLYVKGLDIDWKAFDYRYKRSKVLLPNYPFQREPYWLPALRNLWKKRSRVQQGNTILGELLPSPLEDKIFKNILDLNVHPFLKDHQIFENIIFPGAGFLTIFLSASAKLLKKRSFTLENIYFENPLALDIQNPVDIELHAKSKEKERNYSAMIYSFADGIWRLHCKSELMSVEPILEESIDWQELMRICPSKVDTQDLYCRFDEIGLHLGKEFQVLQNAWVGNNMVIAELESPHPIVLLDGCLQTLSVLLKEEEDVYLPSSIDRMDIIEELPSRIRVQGKLVQAGERSYKGEIKIYALDGSPLLAIKGFTVRKTDKKHLKKYLSMENLSQALYQLRWKPKPLSEDYVNASASWLIASTSIEKFTELNSKIVTPERTLEEWQANTYSGIIWFVTERNSLQHVLNFVHGLENCAKKPNILFVTHGIQSVQPIKDLENAPFNGFFRTLVLERPHLNCRHMDLRIEEPFPVEELFAKDGETQVAYVNRIRYVPRLEPITRLDESSSVDLTISEEGSYLITGGGGGLGLKTAEWLASKGAKHIVLAGRKVFTPPIISGAQVIAISLDVSKRDQVEKAINNFGKEWPELKGIIHAAGITEDGILSTQHWESFEKVFAPKVYGSIYLHEASLNKPLDFFLMFSSIASTLGSPGQINYASANAFLDALAQYRHDLSLPALSIAWGPWSEVGLAADKAEKHRAKGFIPYTPNEALNKLEMAISSQSPFCFAANIDWNALLYHSKLIEDLVAKETTTTTAPILLQRLENALSHKRRDVLTDYLQKTVSKILGSTTIKPDLGFFDAGMDSMMTQQLRERLQNDIGDLHEFPATVAFDNPTVLQLVEYFERNIFPLLGYKTAITQSNTPQISQSAQLSDQIAIIGLSCRFPNNANDPETFWKLLKDGYDGTSEVPRTRWNLEEYYDPDPETPGKMYIRRGGFMNIPMDTFDADFFGISPREAKSMDPQQRLMLEISWEALENACIDPTSLKGSSTGVFVGLSTHDYADLFYNSQPLENINAYMGAGNAGSALSGRISYFLGLQGPSLVIDTACSSSLVSLNYACRSLQSGECHLALAGGVNVMLNPAVTINECKSRWLSKDGYCKTFDASADGFVRGEGAGVIVLKRLDDAIKDKDPILGIVKSTLVNQDGASSGLTVPNGNAQSALINQALRLAKLEPRDVDYIEAHGPGTSLGDPIEFGALSAVFGGKRDKPLVLGSVKTNIGHLEAAAGMAGLIKIVLSLCHEMIPPHLHLRNINPSISLNAIPALIPISPLPWPRSSQPRIAGISSFGFSGTNAHAIIQEGLLYEHKNNQSVRPLHLFTLSAKSPEALEELIEKYRLSLPQAEIGDIAFTANTGRGHFKYRIALTVGNHDELLHHLQIKNYKIVETPDNCVKTAFLFTGKADYKVDFLTEYPLYKQFLEDSRGWQELAFFKMLKHWGIIPDYIMGEGDGDIIAAVAAEIISLEDGWRLLESKEDREKQSTIAKSISYQEPKISIISSRTGQLINKEGIDASYWNLQGKKTSLSEGMAQSYIEALPQDAEVITIPFSWKDLLDLMRTLYLNGVQIDWKSFDEPFNHQKVSLPTYAFQRQRYWIDDLDPNTHKQPLEKQHPLLGNLIPMPNEDKLFRNEIDIEVLSYLKDHKVYEQILFPGAGYIEMMFAMGSAIYKNNPFVIESLSFEQPLKLSENKTILEVLADSKETNYEASIYSQLGQTWTRHSKALLTILTDSTLPIVNWEKLSHLCSKKVDISALYEGFESSGIHYGKPFQSLRNLWLGERDLIAELEGNSPLILIDGCFQSLAAFDLNVESAFLPFSIKSINIFAPIGLSIRVHCQLIENGPADVKADFDIFSEDGKMLLQIQGFHARKTDQQHLKQMLDKQHYSQQWLYNIDWLPVPLQTAKSESNDSWMIISKDKFIIEGLNCAQVRPENAVEEILLNLPSGILWIASGEESIKDCLHLVQQLERQEVKPRLCFITQGIQPLGQIEDLENSIYNGFYKTLRLEMPELDCRHIDILPGEKFPLNELYSDDEERQVAYRNGIRYAPRLTSAKKVEKQKIPIDSSASYLITGGMGGLGLKVAEWLVQQGAKHLVLVGRSLNKKFESQNATIEYAAIDVSQKEEVADLISRFGRDWPELKGVIHAAGIIQDKVLTSQDSSSFDSVFAPKIKGSMNLHLCTLDKKLDYFILFSSIVTVLGSPSQINYASANAFMDALAHYRSQLGLPAISISWGPWAEVGLAANFVDRHRSKGLIAFKNEEGLHALEMALNQKAAHVIAANIDWKHVPALGNLLNEFIEQKKRTVPVLLQLLQNAFSQERKDILIEYLEKTVAKILGRPSIQPDLGFFDAGMDSLMTEELYDKLQTDIGDLHKFPTTIAFDNPTILKLVDYFERNIFPLLGYKTSISVPAITQNSQGLISDQIAIIGMGCRFPKNANDPETFWTLLKEGYDGITEIPKSRWNIDDYYDPDPEKPGKMYTRRGGFLDFPVETFDVDFFGISPREAKSMDPQQRLILEIAWEALENACIDPTSLNGSSTGVFIGLSTHDYADLFYSSLPLESINAYMMTGNAGSALAGRLSYFLGLQGPSMVIDTACSSSLVSLNSACRSLQAGECNLALAGGVNVMLNPVTTINECKSRMLSQDGYCKTFDAEADGFARGEGAGIIVLKRLADAIKDKDHILGIVKSTLVNQDGASSGLTVPNGDSQNALITQALRLAKLEPRDIEYVEAHGTGTALGDPIEFGALSAVFAGKREKPLMLGSVKTNIGHLEAAAGIAGLIKIVLSLCHETIPPHLHLRNINPRIALDVIPAIIPQNPTPWPRSSKPRIAGISSFGFSGSNAHAIIQEGIIPSLEANKLTRPLHLFTLSAKCPEALEELIEKFRKLPPQAEAADIAFTANTCRAHFKYRIALVIEDRDDLLQSLQNRNYQIVEVPQKTAKIAFLFTGKTDYDHEFLTVYPAFNQFLQESEGFFEYAFFKLLKDWGIVPDFILGESDGDIAAAIAAEIITIEEGLKLLESKGNKDLQSAIARSISYQEPTTPIISSRTGELIRKEGIQADYWELQGRTQSGEMGEISGELSHASFSALPQDTQVISMQSNWKDFMNLLRRLYLSGVKIDWKRFDEPFNPQKVSLPTYAFQRQRFWIEDLIKHKHLLNNIQDSQHWFYNINWLPKPLEVAKKKLNFDSADKNNKSNSTDSWLIVSNDEFIIEELNCTRVRPENALVQLSLKSPSGILWIASGEESIKDCLHFIQKLKRQELKPRLFFITRGIQPIGNIEDLENAIYNGFYKTLRLEMPELDCRHIDILRSEKFPLNELYNDDEERQVAYRNEIRYVPRLKSSEKVENQNIIIDASASYLITGGMGGLGLKVAEWLIKKGAKHLVLVGRSSNKKFEASNAIIEYAAIDVSQKEAVAGLISRFGRDWPELKGVIHAAGVIQDKLLTSQDSCSFETVFAPKINGSMNLHTSTLDKKLDFFILFSSFASVLGSPSQINYASANAFMDALAYYRFQFGLPAVSISWGPWSDVGMAEKLVDRHRSKGLIAFKIEEGLNALETAMNLRIPHVIAANIDWKHVPPMGTFLSDLVESKEESIPILMHRLKNAIPSERREILSEHLQRTVGEILGRSSLNADVGFFEAGMDSLMAVELRNKLQEDIGNLLILPSTLALDYPSINKQISYFEDKIFPLADSNAKIDKQVEAKKIVVSDEIAIIGMECCFPGGANHLDLFWELLKKGYDGISEIPPSRWDSKLYFDENPETPGKMYVNRGGFLDIPVDKFDAEFFFITPREAECIDPQQRLLLEVSWRALEQSCINPTSLRGSRTGVFVGASSHDYSDLMSRCESFDNITAYMATGNSESVLSGRLSYFLGLQGPSVTLNTACSSSLVAINYACKSLQTGESDLALAGGVNIILNPAVTINCCKASMLSKDGYCKTFDASADGYVRGEGCGVIVLKRLSDAIEDGDRILGIIKAAEVNQDGFSSGLTVPNREAQTTLIRQALNHAGLEPEDIDYIETHGTGTALGDPIEIEALRHIFKGSRARPLVIGTVKTNIGHLEAAAGVAGIIKTVLALNREAIPPHLHFNHLNPHITFDSMKAEIPLVLTPWPRSNRKRIAGVSSFGFSGTNAHVIVEEPRYIDQPVDVIDRPMHLLTLSARTSTALDALIDCYIQQLPDEKMGDIAYTANTGRAHFSHRIAVIAENKNELIDKLKKGSYFRGTHNQKPKVAFLFTGLNQVPSEFLDMFPIFKDLMEKSNGLFEYAFFELLKSWGITFDAVAGDGLGEISAGVAASIFSLEDGWKLLASENQPAERAQAARSILYRDPQIAFISSITGNVLHRGDMDPLYWIDDEHPRRTKNIQRFDKDTLVISAQTNWNELLQTLGRLYIAGVNILWKSMDIPYHRKKITLPTYPFQKESYWLPSLKNINTISLNYSEQNKTKDKAIDWLYEINWIMKPLEEIDDQIHGTRTKALNTDFERLRLIEPACPERGRTSGSKEDVEAQLGEVATNPNSRTEAIQGIHEEQWLILSNSEKNIEGIQSKTLKFEQIFSELEINPNAKILWFAEDDEFLKQVLEFVQITERMLYKPKVVFLTNGIQNMGDLTDLSHASFNGFFRTLKLEMPSLNCQHIDLCPNESFPLQELYADEEEPQLIYRQGNRYVPRLQHILDTKKSVPDLVIDPMSSYLITGGLGDLGLKVAEWLIEKGAKHLVLISRRTSQLHLPGATVEVQSVDVSKKREVEMLMQKFGTEWPELKGIIHAAGVLEDGLISSQDWSKFEKVFASKIQGSWNLHEASLSKSLDFFVLFSSMASTLGVVGQINYASANAYMDALSAYRRNKGLPSLAIGWGPWKDIGMAASLADRHRAAGVYSFDPGDGIHALELALQIPSKSHVAIINADWKLFPYQIPILKDLIWSTENGKPLLLQQIQNALPNQRQEILLNYLQKTLQKILGIPSFNNDQGFFEAGMDSLMAKELHVKLQRDIGSQYILPSTTVFDYATITQLSKFIEKLLFKDEGKFSSQNKSSEALEESSIINLNENLVRIEEEVRGMSMEDYDQFLKD